jgi:1,4-dihydroxy-2-naphthoyl-CoA synthase
MKSYATIPTETSGDHLLTVTRNRSEVGNAKNPQMGLDLLMFEIEAYNRLVDTEDRREGVLALNEKRKPRFQGR